MRKLFTIYNVLFNTGCLNEYFNFNCQSSIIDNQWSRGQALVTLLFFMIMGITITTAAVIVVFNNASAATVSQQGNDAYYIAESGIDEGLLNLLRNPSFNGNENFSVGDGSVVVNIGNNIVTATGSAQNSIRTIQVKTVYNNNTLSIVSRSQL